MTSQERREEEPGPGGVEGSGGRWREVASSAVQSSEGSGGGQ